MKLIQKNNNVITNHNGGPTKINVQIAGQPFTVYVHIDEMYPTRGKCLICGKEINFKKLNDNLLEKKIVKVVEVVYDNIDYTCESVLTANTFVQMIFTKIIYAVRKKLSVGKAICDKCKPDIFKLLSEGVDIISPRDNKSEIIYALVEGMKKNW